MIEGPQYVCYLPEGADATVVERHENGAPYRTDYHLDGELVGYRYFHRDGGVMAEAAIRGGWPLGAQYDWHENGQMASYEPYEDGKAHGTACQWAEDGRVIGTYTLVHGTGLDLWRNEIEPGDTRLTEAHYYRDGLRHGWEWWIDWDQRGVTAERHWQDGELHGIERDWNVHGRLRRGYPRYWVQGRRLTKRQYLRAAAADSTLPAFREADNDSARAFSPEVAAHLRPSTQSA